MSLKNALAERQQELISTLWIMSSDGPGLTTGDPKDQTNIITRLRSLADSLEHHPETVCTLVLMAGVKATDENGDEGVSSMHIVAGNQSGIAACHLQFMDQGEDAYKDCIPRLLMDVMSDFISPKFTEDDALGEASGISD